MSSQTGILIMSSLSLFKAQNHCLFLVMMVNLSVSHNIHIIKSSFMKMLNLIELGYKRKSHNLLLCSQSQQLFFSKSKFIVSDLSLYLVWGAYNFLWLYLSHYVKYPLFRRINNFIAFFKLCKKCSILKDSL